LEKGGNRHAAILNIGREACLGKWAQSQVWQTEKVWGKGGKELNEKNLPRGNWNEFARSDEKWEAHAR